MSIDSLFDGVRYICGRIQVISDLLWDFPTNLEWYRTIPILGNLPLSVILLVGSGIYFTFRLRFIQVRRFGYGLKILKNSTKGKEGISPLASFFLSTAMRVGPGNILGVTGAISTGGPGALFWMWVSAFFGMATAFTESTLAQLFKEKKGNEYIGGIAHYGKKLLHDSNTAGVFLSILYIVYALLCFPAQGYNTVSSVGQIASEMSGTATAPDSPLLWATFAILIITMICVSFGGVRRISKVTDILVPLMASVYIITVILLIAMNPDRLPYFFKEVFKGAFCPDAIFGGAIGIALSQGIRRGLMSNEAGQGTITMAAAASNVKKPTDQGCIQSIGVFLDTFVICTMTAFVVIMGQQWTGNGAQEWFQMGKLPRFVASAEALAGGPGLQSTVSIIISLCFGLFAFTCLLGFMSFTEICANRISTKRTFINTIRVLCLVVVSFGVTASLAGMDLSALWNLSDLANILMVYFNIPLLYIGFKYVLATSRKDACL